MKVYVIKGQKVGSCSDWFIYNIYVSREKAIKVLTKLASVQYVYWLNEYDLIE